MLTVVISKQNWLYCFDIMRGYILLSDKFKQSSHLMNKILFWVVLVYATFWHFIRYVETTHLQPLSYKVLLLCWQSIGSTIEAKMICFYCLQWPARIFNWTSKFEWTFDDIIIEKIILTQIRVTNFFLGFSSIRS